MLVLGCAPQSCSPCGCSVMRPKKESGVSDGDISDLLDREPYKSEAKVPERHPTTYTDG